MDFNANLVNLIEEDNNVTVKNAVVDEYNLSVSVDENSRSWGACPSWQQPKYRSCQSEVARTSPIWKGHLTKDKNCPVCVEEAGSRVAHWRKKADRKPGVMHLDLPAVEPSADGHNYCLVAAVTVEIDKESKLFIRANAQKGLRQQTCNN